MCLSRSYVILSPSTASVSFYGLTEAEFGNFSSKPICLSSLPILVTDTIHPFSPPSEISRNHAIVIFLLKTALLRKNWSFIVYKIWYFLVCSQNKWDWSINFFVHDFLSFGINVIPVSLKHIASWCMVVPECKFCGWASLGARAGGQCLLFCSAFSWTLHSGTRIEVRNFH